MDAGRLAGLPVFEHLSRVALERIAPLVAEATVDAGAAVTTEGQFGYEFFVVLEGTADVRRDGTLLRSLGPGDFFGEIGLLFSGRRTATALATSPMRLATIFDADLRRLQRDEPQVGAQLRAAARSRLAEADRR